MPRGWVLGVVTLLFNILGIIANIVVGIVGAAIGGWMFGVLGLTAYGLVGRPPPGKPPICEPEPVTMPEMVKLVACVPPL